MVEGAEARYLRQFYAAYQDPACAVLEGLHPATHALRFGGALEAAITFDRDRLLAIAERLAPDVIAPIEAHLEVVGRELFAKLCRRKLTSPLLSIAGRPRQDIARSLAPTGRPVLYLENPRNPGNVGAVIRVAAAAGVEAVLVSGTVDPWSPLVLRSGAGLQFAIPVANTALPTDTTRPIVTVDPRGEPIAAAELDPDSILVVGGERYGISAEVRELATRSVAVPMRPGVASLNLATAVSAVLFSWKAAAQARTGSGPW
ncbi:MAG: TrmH family RNA methyltransferase [Acidimicrobiales bacterium]